MKLGWTNANQIWFKPKKEKKKNQEILVRQSLFYVILSLSEFLQLSWKVYQIGIRTSLPTPDVHVSHSVYSADPELPS